MIKTLLNLFKKPYLELDAESFKAKYMNSDAAVLLDVRTASEFKSGTIPGAKNLDVMSASFQHSVGKLDKSKEYFVFCRSGNRSAGACRIMAGRGLKVYNLKGGIMTWK